MDNKKRKKFLKKSMTETYMKEYLDNNGEIIFKYFSRQNRKK